MVGELSIEDSSSDPGSVFKSKFLDPEHATVSIEIRKRPVSVFMKHRSARHFDSKVCYDSFTKNWPPINKQLSFKSTTFADVSFLQ